LGTFFRSHILVMTSAVGNQVRVIHRRN
jgi:hypothetical protein